MTKSDAERPFVYWFRQAAPYIHAHRGRTFVVRFGGEAVAGAAFAGLIHDFALLHSMGIRLVLVHGTRPQIEQRLKGRDTELRYVNGLRITDEAALVCVKEAAGTVRLEIEALLSMGLANSPMAGARIRVASGNFVTARPVGVRGGVDYQHTGEVRRVDAEAIRQQLELRSIVLLPPIGYSPTGEVFNLHADEVATAVASALRAHKLIFLVEDPELSSASGQAMRQLSPAEAEQRLAQGAISEDMAMHLRGAIAACRSGVARVHLIRRESDGVMLAELFTRDGVGTLITAERYEDMRPAGIDDVGGILELIAPLEAEGVLVRRSRERLETEIDRFTVMERDGTITGCAALYPCPTERVGELACLAVHCDYRRSGRGAALLQEVERQAANLRLERVFVLTTRTAHWFRERGFVAGHLAELPVARQALYNYQRNSKVFLKELSAGRSLDLLQP